NTPNPAHSSSHRHNIFRENQSHRFWPLICFAVPTAASPAASNWTTACRTPYHCLKSLTARRIQSTPKHAICRPPLGLALPEQPLLAHRQVQETVRYRIKGRRLAQHTPSAASLHRLFTMASHAAGSVTPPPPTSVRTPPAPRLGFHDSWEPFSPRKSARLSSQRAAHRTPSPRASQHRKQPASPRIAKKANAQSTAAMFSPDVSPRKKPHPASESSRKVPRTLTSEGTASAAAALGLNTAKTAQKAPTTSISRATGMLPTPSKTPQKPPNQKTATNIQSFARNLFVPEEKEAMPTPRKRRAKKYSGVTMESFTAEEQEDPIEIFTDSQDRVPKKGQSAESTFYGRAAVPEPGKRKGKCQMVNIPGEGAQSIDDARQREDGMVYVFRGKKFFRKFAENDDTQPQEQETYADIEPELTRPLTRFSVKPRLLFPTNKLDEANDEEEAVTDVEDMSKADEAPTPQTPIKAHSAPAKTPGAPRFAPVSPPDTKRTTRSTNKLANEESPMKSPSGRRSPFDAWKRTKEHKAISASKRQGEILAAGTTKRTRS
ncbi:Uncharacterized protein TCAP_02619, partial [Tolypocladium capitatum]